MNFVLAQMISKLHVLFLTVLFIYIWKLGADYFDCMRHCIQIGSLNWCVLVNMVSASIMRNCYFLNSV